MSRPLFLIVGVGSQGHFLVYANNLTIWALDRGFDVAYATPGGGQGFYREKFAHDPRVRFLDLWRWLVPPGPDYARPHQLTRHLALQSQACLEGLYAHVKPALATLTYCDEFFFCREGPNPWEYSFAAPTWGILTFGDREMHLGTWEPYTLRLKEIMDQPRRGFAGLFTLDEHHAAARDPGGNFLRFMPDMFREFDPAPTEPASAHASDLADLRAFLAGWDGAVLPILGKFDRRKNNLWTLRAVCDDPRLACVVLGDRVPDSDTDPEIEALLERLQASGRLFVRWGFVPEALWDEVLGWSRTACVALPYSCHFGSSGVQLMAHRHGLPVVATGQGLMAQRIEAHGLGRTFAPGDESAFRSALSRTLLEGREPYREAVARFMTHFDREALFACFDKAFGRSSHEGAPAAGPSASPDAAPGGRFFPPPATHPRPAMEHLRQDRFEEAARLLDPASPRDCFLLAMTRMRQGSAAQARQLMLRCLEAGLVPEMDFFVDLHLDLVELSLHQHGRESLAWLDGLMSVLLAGLEVPERVVFDLEGFRRALEGDPLYRYTLKLRGELWQIVGAMLAGQGRHREGELSFWVSLHLEPEANDVRLNVSDVLRYAKRYEESWAALDILEGLAPSWPGLKHKRGQVLFELGRLEEARALFRAEPPGSRHHQAARDYLERIEAMA